MKIEINAQPDVLRKTSEALEKKALTGDDACSLHSFVQNGIKKIHILACGTSYHAGKISEPWFEQIAGIPVTTSVASEFVNKPLLDDPNHTLMIFISQSGETQDTLEALHHANAGKFKTLAIVNAENSTIAKEATQSFCTPAGSEKAIAATKSFTSQLAVLAQLALWASNSESKELEKYTNYLKEQLIKEVNQNLKLEESIEKIGAFLATKQHLFCLGSGSGYGMAMESALKNKETSYLHAEAMPIKELRHGPLAMLDATNSAVLILITPEIKDSDLKTALASIEKRQTPVILVGDEKRLSLYDGKLIHKISIPYDHEHFSIISMAPVIQQLAYYRGKSLGLDVDNPRDLVKAVTK